MRHAAGRAPNRMLDFAVWNMPMSCTYRLLAIAVLLCLSACAGRRASPSYCSEKLRHATIAREQADAAVERANEAAEKIQTPSAYADVARYAADAAAAAADEKAVRDECAVMP